MRRGRPASTRSGVGHDLDDVAHEPERLGQARPRVVTGRNGGWLCSLRLRAILSRARRRGGGRRAAAGRRDVEGLASSGGRRRAAVRA